MLHGYVPLRTNQTVAQLFPSEGCLCHHGFVICLPLPIPRTWLFGAHSPPLPPSWWIVGGGGLEMGWEVA